MCLWSCDSVLRSKHNNITKEVSIVALCVIITLIGNNSIPIVNQGSTTTEVIGNFRYHVIV